MSKYVIKFEDNPWYQDDGVGYYKCSEIPWWSAKKSDIKKLTPLDKELDEAYQKGLSQGHKDGYEEGLNDTNTLEYHHGLDDAWEVITKIAKMPDGERGKVFGETRISNIINGNSLAEITEKLKAYEQREQEIKVGDEVIAVWGNAVVVRKYTDKDGVERCEYWYYENARISCDVTSNLRKTGRHFPQMAELIKAMKCEQKSCSTCKYSDGSDVSKCRGCFSSKEHNMWEPKEGAE